ncbi:ER membrane protein SH3 [Microdochium trichocladiopsis]|uniref:ER membrane protein SH3 n=1 Tax=Microdochium trichocladiopsis TaxID=1682393 RepID=A0A9P8YDU9_9PEZI|nr:ER membrane protein SH3 [Microdochium trichocladiopsis]KAH7035141.1 ER membrane protein SH3 [Microdochium trichocladiopsis]
MPDKFVDWSKTTTSRDYRGSSSFATFMIVGPIFFFLGMIFTQLPYDYPLLWTSAPVDPSYIAELETHLKFLHQSPPLISRMLSIMIGVGFLGLFIKLFKASEANMLFDGASLVMYLIGVGIYVANIVKGLRMVSADYWNSEDYLRAKAEEVAGQQQSLVLGKEDSLKVLAASNTILALVLIGVLVLQAGQWYAERKDLQEIEKAAAEAAQAEQVPGSPRLSKKKQ